MIDGSKIDIYLRAKKKNNLEKGNKKNWKNEILKLAS